MNLWDTEPSDQTPQLGQPIDPNNPVIPPNTGSPASGKPYQDINYWGQQGVGWGDIFDPNNKTGDPTSPGYGLKPGWLRTGNGYERDPNYKPPTAGGGGGGAVPPGGLGSLLTPYSVPQPNYVAPDTTGLWGQVGAAPAFPTLPKFNEPTEAQAAAMPGYAFGRDQGIEGLDNSAAARGVTNTGGTLQDIVKFGDQFATQNYQTTRANALEDYQNNIWAQYLAPYAAQQQNWQTKAGLVPSIAGAASTTANNANTFNRGSWQDQYAAWRNRNLDTFNQLYALDTLGSGAA